MTRSLQPKKDESHLDGRTEGLGSTVGRRSTLGQRLAFLFAVFSVAPLAMSDLWGYLQSRRTLTDLAYRNVRSVAAMEAAEVALFAYDRRNLLRSAVAADPELVRLLRGFGSTGATGTARSLANRLRRRLAARMDPATAIEDLLALSPRGELWGGVRAPGLPTPRPSCGGCCGPGLAGSETLGFDRAGGRPALWARLPIVDPSGGRLGFLCGRFALDTSSLLAPSGRNRVEDASFYLLDEGGRRLAGVEDRPAPNQRGDRLEGRGGGLAAGTPAWTAAYDLPSGASVVGAFAPIPEVGGGVLVEIPTAPLTGRMERLKRQAIAFGILLLGVLLAAVIVASRGLAAPLRRLAEAAGRAAAGEPGALVPLEGPREVAQLAGRFNQMVGSLRSSIEDQDRRIEERTRDLRRAQEFTELLLNSIDQRVVVVDRDLHVVKANGVALRDYGDDLIGRCCFEVFDGRDQVCDDCAVRRTFETREHRWTERSELLAGRREILRLDTFPVVSAAGRVDAVVEIGRVVTAEKRMQAELLHQEKMAAFGLLAAGVAHEIGNPLASIESQLRIAREAPEPGRLQQTLSVVEDEVRRVSRLLRDLVDFARRRRDEQMWVAVNEVVEDVSRLVGHDPRARNVRIERHLKSGLPGVRAKEDHLVQVLLNLALNAIDAMPDGGTLIFSTGFEGDTLRIRVQDTGEGIPEEARAHLFEPFYTTKGPARGTGLGLFVSRGIAEGLGGRLEVARTGASGTEFVLSLPIPGTEGTGAAT